MKKFLTMLLFAGSIVSTFAAFQYNVGSVSTKFGDMDSGSFAFDSDMSITMEANRSSLRGFGYYNLSDGVKVDGDMKTGALGNFKAGDDIGIWLLDQKGNIYTSTETSFGTFVGTDVDKKGYVIYSGPEPGIARGQWKYTLDGQETPSGQPLPGILATLLLGGAVTVRLRNKKTSAN